jgi:two-component system LytT family response regulator
MERKIKSIIVEDEIHSRETLRNYLTKYCPSIEVIDEAVNVTDAIEKINQQSPELIFLDIEMPFGNAFDLLDKINIDKLEVIFVTAYDNYALRAIQYSATSYLLKPINIDELIDAVDKAIENINKGDSSEFNMKTKVLLDNLKLNNAQHQKIVLPTLEGFEIIKVTDVIRCQANDNFTVFYLTDGSKQMICRTLKFYEGILTDLGFKRVHKSHLVNLEYIKSYKRGKVGVLKMIDDSEVLVSASKKESLMEFFKA